MIQPVLKTLHCFPAIALTLFACGCHIPNQAYRSGDLPNRANAPVIVVDTPPQLPVSKNNPWPRHPEVECNQQNLKNLLGRPCLAFLEFDDFGETWQKTITGSNASVGRPTQLDKIVELIVAAKKQDPSGEPLILTFVHGWKHNASQGKGSGDDDDNIIGLESTINRLHDPVTGEWRGHVVIGIYLSWRGGLISRYWPVSQQFTYWNREATAIRVGNSSMTDALIEIADAAKRTGDCGSGDLCYRSESCASLSRPAPLLVQPPSTSACTPLVLFVGHSFGALVMERALTQATITRMEGQWNQQRANRLRNSDQPADLTPLADLVIYVNSAAAATESKQLMDYLASTKSVYQPASHGEEKRDEPLFLSITSEADLATGLLLKIGHAVPLIGYKFKGSMRASSAGPVAIPDSGQQDVTTSTTSYARACFEPATKTASIKTDMSETDYYLTTTAHAQALWSHTVTQKAASRVVKTGDPICIPGTNPIYSTCTIGTYDYVISNADNRCNGTPYWALQVQKELIPDHTTIFTERLIDFLTAFIQPPSQEGQPSNRPQLQRPM